MHLHEWSGLHALTLLLTTDVTSHILQGLTVTPFKFHLLIPQAITNPSFVRPPGYGMNYQLSSLAKPDPSAQREGLV